MCNGVPGHKIKVKSGTTVLQSPDTEEILRSFIPETDLGLPLWRAPVVQGGLCLDAYAVYMGV